MNKQNFENLIRANRECHLPDKFDMHTYGHPCGTPGCVLGQYAAREDLQSAFKLTGAGRLWSRDGLHSLWSGDELVAEHFGITWTQALELFGVDGCGRAQTPEQAAAYIEKFVKENSGE